MDAAQQFQKNNGMTIEEAYSHVQTWYNEDKYSEVIQGCEEIIKYIPDYKDIQAILADVKNKAETNSDIPPPVTATQTEVDNRKTETKTTPVKKKQEMYTSQISTDEKILSTIGYLGFLCVLPLLLKKDSKYCSFHGKQALVLAIFFFLYKYVAILRDLPGIGGMIQFLLGISMFIELAVIIFAMLQAYRGKYWKIPAIHNIAAKLNF